MKLLIILFLSSMITFSQNIPDNLRNLINKGEFITAEKIIDSLLTSGSISEKQKLNLIFEKERMERIKKDFRLSGKDILDYIKKFIPGASKDDISKWEKEGFLEFRIIDGKKFYFNRAHTNFFLLNKKAAAIKKQHEAKNKRENFREFLKRYVKGIEGKIKSVGETLTDPVEMKLDYTLSVNAGAVPPGDIIRCWLPFPREGKERQTGINLISANSDEYIVASNRHQQRTIYLEKPAEQNKPTIFNIKFKVKTFAQKFVINPETIKPYDKTTEIYKKYTAERFPHILFTDKIKNLSQKIIGNETNPYLKAKKIFTWISENIPWAGAREYSTIRNISDYCITNKHGDCGIKSMLFITLCRYNGIPAKWQSGWMLHPGFVNLHDWSEIYFEGIGWIPVDQSFGLIDSENEFIKYFYFGGTDAYHLIINDDFSTPLFPAKIFPRSETVDFQRGEVEWKGGNLYFDKWDYNMKVEYN